MSKKMLTALSLLLAVTLLSAKDKDINNVQNSHVWQDNARATLQMSTFDEFDAIADRENVLVVNPSSANFNRGLADTMQYIPADGAWNGQFIQSPGDAMLVMYKMPADGIIKGINVPVYEWGTGDQQLTVSLHTVSYPYASDGTTYPLDAVDGAGWIGGYDMDADGHMAIEGTSYSAGGTAGICDPADAVLTGSQDPLGTTAATSGPPGVPTMGLIWPSGFTAATMDPTNHPDFAVGGNTANWIATSSVGSEPDTLLQDTWVGILVAFTGAGDDSGDDATGFFYEEASGVVEPWIFSKFYAGCGGTSGNGGWHIRHWMVNYQLAVELTGDRGPQLSHSALVTTLSTDDLTVSVGVKDDNPSQGPAGAAAVTVTYMIDSTTAAPQTVSLSLVSGTDTDGTWEGDIPGQTAGTDVYYSISATDVGGLSTATATFFYSIFAPEDSSLFFYNSGQFGSWIQGYYLYNSPLAADFWGSSYGSGPSILWWNYDLIVEMTGGGPDVINSRTLEGYLMNGGDYILAGDEWLGAQTGWVNTDYDADDFREKWLGVDADFNDIGYPSVYGGTGVSRLFATDGDAISGDLYTFLQTAVMTVDTTTGDTTYSAASLNYDPNYEIGVSNWLDGVTPTSTSTVAFTGHGGPIDTTGASMDSTVYATGIYQEHSSGADVAFFTFDPLSLNTSPVYYWIGIQTFGALQEAVAWAKSDVQRPLSVGDEALPSNFSLKGNYPNPFNPTTNIAFDLGIKSDVKVRIYSLLGQEVAFINASNLNPGSHNVIWNGLNSYGQSVASGVYLYQVEAAGKVLTGKMMMLK